MKKRLSLKNKKGIFVTILPVSLWMLAFFIVPLLLILVVSFCTRGETGDIIFKFTLSNYERMFNKLYLVIFLKSLMVSVFTTLICLIFGYPFAFIIARANKKN